MHHVDSIEAELGFGDCDGAFKCSVGASYDCVICSMPKSIQCALCMSLRVLETFLAAGQTWSVYSEGWLVEILQEGISELGWGNVVSKASGLKSLCHSHTSHFVIY